MLDKDSLFIIGVLSTPLLVLILHYIFILKNAKKSERIGIIKSKLPRLVLILITYLSVFLTVALKDLTYVAIGGFPLLLAFFAASSLSNWEQILSDKSTIKERVSGLTDLVLPFPFGSILVESVDLASKSGLSKLERIRQEHYPRFTKTDPNYILCPHCSFEQWVGYKKCQKCDFPTRVSTTDSIELAEKIRPQVGSSYPVRYILCPNCDFEQWEGFTDCQKCGFPVKMPELPRTTVVAINSNINILQENENKKLPNTLSASPINWAAVGFMFLSIIAIFSIARKHESRRISYALGFLMGMAGVIIAILISSYKSLYGGQEEKG